MGTANGDLWEFSLKLYSEPGVAASCLSLQNQHGFDVNLVLFCIWYGFRHGELTEDLLEQIDLSSGVSVLGTPGLVGNQTQVQLDVSRLPRLEEYVAMLDANTADIDDIPSDIKTVAYFVQSSDTLGGVEDALATATAELDWIRI